MCIIVEMERLSAKMEPKRIRQHSKDTYHFVKNLDAEFTVN